MNRGKNENFKEFATQRQRFKQAFSTGRKHDDGQMTSRFDDSRFDGQTSADRNTEAEPVLNWYERRNRFIDLHLHVQGLRSRIVRTPELQARITQEMMFDQKQTRRRLSHSPGPSKAKNNAKPQ